MNTVDIQSLTLGEVDEFENLTGASIAAVADEEKPKGKVLAALVYIFQKRTIPEYTLSDAFKLSIPEATAFLGFDAAEPEEDSEAGKG